MEYKQTRQVHLLFGSFLILGGISSIFAASTGVTSTTGYQSASYTGGATAKQGNNTNSTNKYSIPERSSYGCSLLPDAKLHELVMDMIKNNVELINYVIHFENYSRNPLLQGQNWTYRGNEWSRSSSRHGQALLALSFNYGILSLTTLTFGVHVLQVKLKDHPTGCLGKLSEDQKVLLIQDLLMHDFKTSGRPTLGRGEYICHQVILNENGFARFSDRCCRRNLETDKAICHIDIQNVWIRVFEITLSILKVLILLFGPLLMPTQMYSEEFESHRYVVKFKEYVRKTIYISHDTTIKGGTPKHILDLRRMPGFKRCKEIVANLDMNKIIPIKLKEYDISVAYRKLICENKVPVGLIRSFIRAFCQCKIREVGPFKECCTTNLYGKFNEERPIPWIRLWKNVGRFLMVILIPSPFYVRLVFYYFWEHDELEHRKKSIYERGLKLGYDNKLIYFFTPVHPLLVIIYIVYFTTCFVLAFCTAKWWRRHFQRTALDAFRDLNDLSQLNALGMVINNFVWPLKRFGLLGFLLGLVYWPLIMPITLVIYIFYCVPLVYVIIRMIAHSKTSLLKRKERFEREAMKSEADQKAGLLETSLVDKVRENQIRKNERRKSTHQRYSTPKISVRELILQAIISCMCVVSLLAVMIMFSECLGFLTEIAVFTLMGIIVNAGVTLRYVTLVLLVVLYAHDCYSHCYTKYCKLNRAVFNDIKFRIKGLEEVTMLPSELQENQGFKSVEESEQAEHEQPDELSRELDVTRQRLPLCWDINDLILFVDKEDTPRIPRKLFDSTCNIRVSGAPGPVYRSLLAATGRFSIIIFFLLFVFLVVMSFGEVYNVSSSKQTLGAVAGGFLPFMLRYILKPKAPDPQLGSVSFKAKLDEIIKNFRQSWPLHDFPFKVSCTLEFPKHLNV